MRLRLFDYEKALRAMEKIASILFYTALAVLIGGLCFIGGARQGKRSIEAGPVISIDTVWVEVHDTAFVEKERELLRIDTVKLAYVPKTAELGLYSSLNGPEIAELGLYTDTLFIHDSVYVEVPIERKAFIGERYRIVAHGYKVGIDDVWFDYPVITSSTSNVISKRKRWGFSVGAQIGYGYTSRGAAPYIGLGVGFGYNF